MVKAVKDDAILAKVHVFVSTANILQELLEILLSDKPLAPFLHQYIHDILHEILSKIVSSRYLLRDASLPDMMSLDLAEDKVLKPAKDVHLNFATKQALKDEEVKDQDLLTFRCDVKSMLVGFF